jgi:two-component system sensor histidine kinase/response regulator
MEERTPKVLIVDDAPENIDILTETLNGYKNIVALNGEKALEIAHKNPKPDLILLDVIMPGMDGFEVCRKLKASELTSDIPVIFITSEDQSESISTGFRLGGVDYVTKPFQADELTARVKTHLELKFSREKLEKVNEYLQKEVNARTRELQALNTELEETKEDLESLDVAKSQFLKMISHEIRTPLNGIIGATDMMKSQAAPDSGNNFIWMLDESAKRLEKFSRMALSITDLTVKKETSVHPEKLPLKDILLSAVSAYNQNLQEKSVKINYHGFEKDVAVFADPKITSRSFQHLLDNAIKFSSPFTDIQISLQQNKEFATVEIKDQGAGFSDQALKKLFQPFEPGEEHVNDNIGLGLYFVKLATDAQKGMLEVGNNHEKGAFARLSLKIAT